MSQKSLSFSALKDFRRSRFFLIGLVLIAAGFLFAFYQFILWQQSQSKPADASVFSWDTQILDSPGNIAQDQAIDATDANNIFIAYTDGDNNDIKFAKSDNGGSSFTFSVIDSNASPSYVDIEALDANNLFVIYASTGNTNLMLATSSNGGMSWSTSTIASNQDVRNPHLDVFDANNMVAYWYCNSFCFDARFAVSSTGGSSWTVSDPLPGLNGGNFGDVYMADANNVYILITMVSMTLLLLRRTAVKSIFSLTTETEHLQLEWNLLIQQINHPRQTASHYLYYDQNLHKPGLS